MNLAALWSVRLLSIAAVGLSVYLLQASLTAAGVAGCDWEAFDCDAALGSRWAKWFGLPVAVGGTLCYAAAAIGSFLIGRGGGLGATGWRLLEAAVPAAVGAGLWFTALQATTLGSFCLYCLLTHACGVVIAGLTVLLRRQASSGGSGAPLAIGLGQPSQPSGIDTGPPSLGLPTAAGVAAILALVAGQLLGPKPTPVAPQVAELPADYRFDAGVEPTAAIKTDTADDEAETATESAPEAAETKRAQPKRDPNGSRIVKLLRGKLPIDTYAQPILGSPEAPHVVVELMDYACPHCRELHEKLTEAIERFDGQVAVVVLPVPGEITCNPYATKARQQSQGACFAAKLALSVADLAPESFADFHHWMLKDDNIPNRTSALLEARRFVDRNDLSEAIRDAEGQIAARIKQHIELTVQLRQLGVRGVPTQLFGEKAHSAKIESVDEIITLWSEEFGLSRPGVELPF